MMDKDNCAAARFFAAVRDFAESAQPYTQGVTWYRTKPDETRDFTLISERVYGVRHEILAVMAVCHVDTIDDEVKQSLYAFPNAATLYALKRDTGFESDPEMREDFTPIWAE